MNSAQSVGALVIDASGLVLTVQGGASVVLPMSRAFPSENDGKLRDVFKFRGQLGFGGSVRNTLRAYVAPDFLMASGHQLVARKPDGIEVKLSLGLKKYS